MGKKEKIKASIDIGSNTVLLLIGTIESKKIQAMHEEQFAPRLGKGVDSQNNLNSDAMDRVIEVLQKYKEQISAYHLGPEEVRVVATSAVRDANNRQLFVDRIGKKTGFGVEILSGEEEAELTFLGAKSMLGEDGHNVAVIDIGGGSTEVAVGNDNSLTDRYSFDIGSVRFTERYLQNRIPKKSELNRCRKAIRKAFANRLFNLTNDAEIIGVSGTITSLVAIELGLQTYQPEKINGYHLSLERISFRRSTFFEVTADRLLESYPNILKGRADVFLAGLLILEGFMEHYDILEIVASTGGIRHGALLNA